MPVIDQITLEVMKNAFYSITEEMGAALVRSAYSTNIKDRRDFSCALYTPEGHMLAQAMHIPLHLGAMACAIKGMLKVFPPEELHSGDVVILNDPYLGAAHKPDIMIFTPIFFNGEFVAIVGNTAHHIDVGGMIPGSVPPNATETFQEGITIPPVKLNERGILNKGILQILEKNVRTLHEFRGDLMAQLAANNVGERRFRELCEQNGSPLVREAMTKLEEYCERRMVQEIQNIPEGVYTHEDSIEGDGITEDLFWIRCSITVRKGTIHIDFTGSSPCAKGPINSVYGITLACVYYAVKALTDPSIPTNEGTFKPVELTAPERTLVNAPFPYPMGLANTITSQRIVDVLFGAFYHALPGRVCAACTGSMNSCGFGGINPRTQRYFSYVETYGGGYGATRRRDGISGVHSHMTNSQNAPTEVIEMTYPLRVEKYELIPDSEGPGKFRGGFGITRELRVLETSMRVRASTDRVVKGPYGLEGGWPGGRAQLLLEQSDGSNRKLPSKSTFEASPGDRIIIRTAGGGGWGNPKERAPEEVREDVVQGLIDIDRAREIYGVEIDPQTLKIDPESPEKKRRREDGGD
jgi:N-methylhydantoinase B